ncbi:MAG TPA: fumarylacetoacetase [Ignavibacteria bacterium]|nr:fumarylacetoacetase [Ignavibacteria bacterium]
MIKSFIPVSPDSHFPIQNLPFGAFKHRNFKNVHICTAIGEFVVDLTYLAEKNFFSVILKDKHIFSDGSLNKFMALDSDIRKDFRKKLQSLLDENNKIIRDDVELREKCIYQLSKCELVMPVKIGDYTDFYSSKEHATNVGIMFRGKENALMPNWLHLPVGYHGRASSVIISGTEIHRPSGQTKADNEEMPKFGPSKLLDFELEMGFFISQSNELGHPVNVNDALQKIFGLVIVNDWSARDIQKWEYVPLGPFLAKNFATSISPWIVTLEALEPFKTDNVKQEPEPLPYLKPKRNFTYDITLEVAIQTEKLDKPFIISKSNFSYLYWSMQQQLAHHTITGCNLQTGDLLASGTISGEAENSRGSMLELTWRGENPLKLPNGEERKFIQDGDTIIMTAYCQGDGYKIGFGEVTGKILPALK